MWVIRTPSKVLTSCTGAQGPIQRAKQYTIQLTNGSKTKKNTMDIPLCTGERVHRPVPWCSSRNKTSVSFHDSNSFTDKTSWRVKPKPAFQVVNYDPFQSSWFSAILVSSLLAVSFLVFSFLGKVSFLLIWRQFYILRPMTSFKLAKTLCTLAKSAATSFHSRDSKKVTW